MNKKLGDVFDKLNIAISSGIKELNKFNDSINELKNQADKYKFKDVSDPSISNEELVFNLILNKKLLALMSERGEYLYQGFK